MVINTGASDLSALSAAEVIPSEQHLYIGIQGLDGAGADPSYGRTCIEQHENQIRQRVAAWVDAYDQLVNEYEGTEDSLTRMRVATRLRSDAEAADSLTRYYAVRAMSKLDLQSFNAALLAATKDEDASVRAVANKALGR